MSMVEERPQFCLKPSIGTKRLLFRADLQGLAKILTVLSLRLPEDLMVKERPKMIM